MTSKEYYRNRYHPQLELSLANIRLYNFILDLDIQTIFEFGCNVGRHLTLLQNWDYKVTGCDINEQYIIDGRKKGLNLYLSDEEGLHGYANKQYDLCFTNSVLCHMPEIEPTIKNLKRMAKHVVLVECVNKYNDHWYVHNYEGFTEQMELRSAVIDHAVYKLFYWCE